MKAPEDSEHLDPAFWDRVQPDPDTDCLIFQTQALHPTFGGKEILTYLTGSDGRQKHRACRRRLCVNPDHVVYEKYTPVMPGSRKPRTQRAFSRWYAQC